MWLEFKTSWFIWSIVFIKFIEPFPAPWRAMITGNVKLVFGTRTSKSMIEAGSKMYSYLRYGNIIVAKLLEYLFSGPCLTDVGCSYKAFKSKSLKNIVHKLKVKGSHFQPELMIRLIQENNKIIEIPVYYLRRSGYSKITYNFYSSLRVALNMIKVIIFIYFKKFFK